MQNNFKADYSSLGFYDTDPRTGAFYFLPSPPPRLGVQKKLTGFSIGLNILILKIILSASRELSGSL